MHAPPTAPRLVHVAAAAPRRPAAVSLLDLPIEVIDLIVRWVALLRYDYSESRRPVPSALHHVACGTNKLLRRVALPYLFRTWQSRSDSHRRVWVPGARGLVDTREFVRTWRQPRDDTGRVDDPRSLPRLESLVFFELPEVGAPDVPFPSVTHVEVRRGQRDRARAWFGRLPALTSCTISDPQAHLLPVLHTRPRLVDLAVTVEPTTRIDMDNPVWRQLRRLEVQVVKPRAGGGSAPVLNPLAFLLETIRYVRVEPHGDLCLSGPQRTCADGADPTAYHRHPAAAPVPLCPPRPAPPLGPQANVPGRRGARSRLCFRPAGVARA